MQHQSRNPCSSSLKRPPHQHQHQQNRVLQASYLIPCYQKALPQALLRGTPGDYRLRKIEAVCGCKITWGRLPERLAERYRLLQLVFDHKRGNCLGALNLLRQYFLGRAALMPFQQTLLRPDGSKVTRKFPSSLDDCRLLMPASNALADLARFTAEEAAAERRSAAVGLADAAIDSGVCCLTLSAAFAELEAASAAEAVAELKSLGVLETIGQCEIARACVCTLVEAAEATRLLARLDSAAASASPTVSRKRTIDFRLASPSPSPTPPPTPSPSIPAEHSNGNNNNNNSKQPRHQQKQQPQKRQGNIAAINTTMRQANNHHRPSGGGGVINCSSLAATSRQPQNRHQHRPQPHQGPHQQKPQQHHQRHQQPQQRSNRALVGLRVVGAAAVRADESCATTLADVEEAITFAESEYPEPPPATTTATTARTPRDKDDEADNGDDDKNHHGMERERREFHFDFDNFDTYKDIINDNEDNDEEGNAAATSAPESLLLCGLQASAADALRALDRSDRRLKAVEHRTGCRLELRQRRCFCCCCCPGGADEAAAGAVSASSQGGDASCVFSQRTSYALLVVPLGPHSRPRGCVNMLRSLLRRLDPSCRFCVVPAGAAHLAPPTDAKKQQHHHHQQQKRSKSAVTNRQQDRRSSAKGGERRQKTATTRQEQRQQQQQHCRDYSHSPRRRLTCRLRQDRQDRDQRRQAISHPRADGHQLAQRRHRCAGRRFRSQHPPTPAMQAVVACAEQLVHCVADDCLLGAAAISVAVAAPSRQMLTVGNASYVGSLEAAREAVLSDALLCVFRSLTATEEDARLLDEAMDEADSGSGIKEEVLPEAFFTSSVGDDAIDDDDYDDDRAGAFGYIREAVRRTLVACADERRVSSLLGAFACLPPTPTRAAAAESPTASGVTQAALLSSGGGGCQQSCLMTRVRRRLAHLTLACWERLCSDALVSSSDGGGDDGSGWRKAGSATSGNESTQRGAARQRQQAKSDEEGGGRDGSGGTEEYTTDESPRDEEHRSANKGESGRGGAGPRRKNISREEDEAEGEEGQTTEENENNRQLLQSQRRLMLQQQQQHHNHQEQLNQLKRVHGRVVRSSTAVAEAPSAAYIVAINGNHADYNARRRQVRHFQQTMEHLQPGDDWNNSGGDVATAPVPGPATSSEGGCCQCPCHCHCNCYNCNAKDGYSREAAVDEELASSGSSLSGLSACCCIDNATTRTMRTIDGGGLGGESAREQRGRFVPLFCGDWTSGRGQRRNLRLSRGARPPTSPQML